MGLVSSLLEQGADPMTPAQNGMLPLHTTFYNTTEDAGYEDKDVGTLEVEVGLKAIKVRAFITTVLTRV